jgi:hypothetical protein
MNDPFSLLRMLTISLGIDRSFRIQIMDIYTTSFCIPRTAIGSSDLSTTSSLDLPRNEPTATVTGSSSGTTANASQSQQADPSSIEGSSDANAQRRSTSSAHTTDTATTASSAASLASTGTTSAASTNGPATSPTSPGGVTPTTATSGIDINEAMQRLCVDAMANHQCLVSFAKVESETQGGKPLYNFHLSGGYQQVMGARGAILRDSPFKVYRTINASSRIGSCR